MAPAHDRAERNELITIFGGGGFVGRYVCELLLKSGARIRVAQRDPRTRLFHPAAGPGRPVRLRPGRHHQRDSVRARVHGATAVINLCGVFGKAMHAVHVDGARNVAEAGARRRRPSRWSTSRRSARTRIRRPLTGGPRREGEDAVRKAFPNATIVRPSLVFGPEDELTNRFAGMARLPFLPVIAAQPQFPAGLCPRPRQGDRQGRARAAGATAARPTRSAARRC